MAKAECLLLLLVCTGIAWGAIQRIKVEHSFDGGRTYSPRQELTIETKGANLETGMTARVDPVGTRGQIGAAEASALDRLEKGLTPRPHELLIIVEGGRYYLKVDGPHPFVTSVPVCGVGRSRDEMTVVLDSTGGFLGLSYRPQCLTGPTPPLKSAWDTSFDVLLSSEGVKPAKELKLDASPEQQGGGGSGGIIGMMFKYWYFVVPLVLLLVVNAAVSATDARGAGGGART